jgi:hypothetical protein
MKFVIFAVLVSLLSMQSALSGIIGYGLCQTGCNGLAVACYAAGGCIFGTFTAGTATPAVILACNAGLSACMMGCIAAGALSGPV